MRPLLKLFWLDLSISSIIVLLNILIPYLAKDYFKIFALILFPFYLALILGVAFVTLVGNYFCFALIFIQS